MVKVGKQKAYGRSTGLQLHAHHATAKEGRLGTKQIRSRSRVDQKMSPTASSPGATRLGGKAGKPGARNRALIVHCTINPIMLSVTTLAQGGTPMEEECVSPCFITDKCLDKCNGNTDGIKVLGVNF